MNDRKRVFNLVCRDISCGAKKAKTLTPQQFIDIDHICPKCQGPMRKEYATVPFSHGVLDASRRMGLKSSYVSDRLPAYAAGCRVTDGSQIRPGTNKPYPVGKPIIEGRNHEREVFARLGYERE